MVAILARASKGLYEAILFSTVRTPFGMNATTTLCNQFLCLLTTKSITVSNQFVLFAIGFCCEVRHFVEARGYAVESLKIPTEIL